MAGPSPQQRFHYLGVLEALHKRCALTRRKGKGTQLAGSIFQRVRFASPPSALVALKIRVFKDGCAQTKNLLKLSVDKARALEAQLLRDIDAATGTASGDKGIRSRPWPPRLSNQEITERFVALALGLHAEGRMSGDPVKSLRNAIQGAAKMVVAPALAWALQMEVSELHEDSQPKTLGALRDSLPSRLQGFGATQGKGPESYGDLPRLLHLATAWHQVLAEDLKLGQTAAVECLGQEIVDNLSHGGSANNRAVIFPKLHRIFGWGEAGSARALAIEHCRKSGALTAKLDTRLTLLEAANSQHVRPFRELLDHKPDLAQLKSKVNEPNRADAIQLAGEAFWLSRACFRRTAGAAFQVAFRGPRDRGELYVLAKTDDAAHLDACATLAYERLTLALGADGLDAVEKATVLRFRAGLATNPRYWRSTEVIEKAADAVKAYADSKLANPALVEHFRARLAWMEAVDTDGELGKELNRVTTGYALCLSKAGADFSKLDAEAPVHLFPELLHLLQLDPKSDAARQRDLLEIVDFILSRNFGVYMDIETERKAIEGGLRQAGCAKDVLRSREKRASSRVVV